MQLSVLGSGQYGYVHMTAVVAMSLFMCRCPPLSAVVAMLLFVYQRPSLSAVVAVVTVAFGGFELADVWRYARHPWR